MKELRIEDLNRFSIPEIQEIMKDFSKTECTEDDISLICHVYMSAVAMGEKAEELAEVCKNTLKIIRLGKEHLVNSKLHFFLCRVPDTYFDFIWGVENNVKNDYEKQMRIVRFMEEFRGVDSFAVIVFNSLINENPDISDEHLYKLIHTMDKKGFTEYELMLSARDRKMYEFTNHDWVMCKTFINGKPYTVRLCRSACLVDSANVCISSGCMVPYNETTGRIIYTDVPLERDGVDLYPGIRELILDVQMYVAKHKGYSKVFITKEADDWAFYQQNGFRPANGVNFGFAGETVLARDVEE